jgi:hypothetical protein
MQAICSSLHTAKKIKNKDVGLPTPANGAAGRTSDCNIRLSSGMPILVACAQPFATPNLAQHCQRRQHLTSHAHAHAHAYEPSTSTMPPTSIIASTASRRLRTASHPRRRICLVNGTSASNIIPAILYKPYGAINIVIVVHERLASHGPRGSVYT